MRTMKITHSAFDSPPMSWLRKMSLKTTISSQIQMKNRKNHSIDRKTCPVPKSEARGIFLLEKANGTATEVRRPLRKAPSPIGVKLCHPQRSRHHAEIP